MPVGSGVARVRHGRGDAHLPCTWRYRYAQEFQWPLWPGARSVAVRPDERACIFVFQRTKESTEDFVFRWHGTLGLRETNRARPPSLAFCRCWAVQVCVEPRRICAARGRHRSDRNKQAQVVSQVCWRGIKYVTNDRINTVEICTYPQHYLLQNKHRERASPTYSSALFGCLHGGSFCAA